jgi:uncharacterized membrane protein
MSIAWLAEGLAQIIDLAGVSVIAGGLALVTFLSLRRLIAREPGVYSTFRQQLGRAILLGLELLVAADIIRTVAVRPSLESVAVLGLIVLVRTFLSFAMEVEITGRWPWQQAGDDTGGDRGT